MQILEVACSIRTLNADQTIVEDVKLSISLVEKKSTADRAIFEYVPGT
jgi:hypothetical protein